MLARLMLAGFLAAGFAAAQRGGGGMGGGDDMGSGGMGRRGGGDMGASMPMSMQRKASKLELLVEKLKLDKDQRDEFLKILSAAAERAGSVRLDMDQRRAKIAGAMIDGKPGDEIEKLTAEYATAAAQMTKIEADAFAKIYAILKPNQQSKAGQSFELMAGMFSGQAGGRGGAGRGRGGEGR